MKPLRLPPRRRGAILAIATLAAAATVVVGVVTVPRASALSSETAGDAELIERARPLLEGARGSVAIAVIEEDEVDYALFGADERTDFELGSITKTFTGGLLADAIEREEVSADDRLGDILPLGEAPAADVTLEELATHRSGLPRLATRPGDVAGSLWAIFRHTDPYPVDVDGLVAQAKAATLDGRGSYAYSNLGVGLLGQALANRAWVGYDELVEQRILAPLGMNDSYAPLDAAKLRSGYTTGMNAAGRSEAPWTMKATAPAGGIRSTISDMVLYARAQLDGVVPGASALEPREDAGDGRRIGLNWFTSDSGGAQLQWHNGGTGGFASMIVLDRSRGRAVVVLSSTASSVDEVGFELLKGER